MKRIPSEILQRIQAITLKHKKIKLIIRPAKVLYDDAPYGDNIVTKKYMAYMPSCKYKPDDVVILNMMVKAKDVCNMCNNPNDVLTFIFELYNKNHNEFNLSITPYPDDISKERSNDINYVLGKLK